jgi:integrase
MVARQDVHRNRDFLERFHGTGDCLPVNKIGFEGIAAYQNELAILIFDNPPNGSMFRRLQAKTGIICNTHVFRRTFAVPLRKAGINSMTIKELGRWESLEMVQRYTRSFAFEDSMKFYMSPLS